MAGKKSPPGPTGETVRDNIRRLMGLQNRQYAELSRQLEELGRPIPPLGLRRIVAGERQVDVDELMALSVALKTTPLMLLLPHVKRPDLDYTITGLGEFSSHGAWLWARGFGSRRETLYTGPREEFTRRRRAEDREFWRDERIEQVEVLLDPGEHPEIHPAVARAQLGAALKRVDDIEDDDLRVLYSTLQRLDPDDGTGFVDAFGFDPSPAMRIEGQGADPVPERSSVDD